MKSILLSIKPKFANKIISGQKKWEYRKSIPKNEFETVYIYSSSPVKKIIAKCSCPHFIECPLDVLWAKTKDYSGISKEYFDKYFEGKESGFAIFIDDYFIFEKPKDLKDFQIKKAPQNFMYIDNKGFKNA